MPYQTLTDEGKRKEAFKHKSSLPLFSLYRGFERSLIKESVFTASYVMGSAYFGTFFQNRRQTVALHLAKLYPALNQDEKKKEKYTDVACASLKAASAGAVSTILAAPIDMAGKKMSAPKAIATVGRKAVRKACYNGINTVIVQYLYSSKIHRRVLNTTLNPAFLEMKMAEEVKTAD